MSYDDLDVEESGDYFKFVAGTPVKLHLLSRTPEKEKVHWINKKKSTCIGLNCENCLAGDKPKQRWKADAWDRKENKVKKFEFGAQIAGQLRSIANMLSEQEQTIHDTDLRIETTGSDLETKYSVLPVPIGGPIPQEILDKYQVPF